jgi:23S rRNA pseudouridine1911/1915/1917 synthase
MPAPLFALLPDPGYSPAMPDPAPPLGTLHIVAGPEAEGERLDRFLAERIGNLSRSRVKSLIEAGLVLREGQTVVEPAASVRAGITYSITFPPVRQAAPEPEPIAFPIIYEDADLLVLDKPAGLVVHPAPGNESGTLVNAVIAHCGPALSVGSEQRPGIVHRLDKDTSGLMVVAKTEMAMLGLTAAFAARNIDRTYLALVWGLPNPSAGEIEGAIGRDPRDRKRMAIRAHAGKPALTRYRMLRSWFGSVALLECRLATGRTHQIRVHLSSRGHPVVGDPVYLRRIPAAARGVPEPVRGTLLDFPRQALHAARLGFTHPVTGQVLSFESPPPPDLAALLDSLERDPRTPQS